MIVDLKKSIGPVDLWRRSSSTASVSSREGKIKPDYPRVSAEAWMSQQSQELNDQGPQQHRFRFLFVINRIDSTVRTYAGCQTKVVTQNKSHGVAGQTLKETYAQKPDLLIVDFIEIINSFNEHMS